MKTAISCFRSFFLFALLVLVALPSAFATPIDFDNDNDREDLALFDPSSSRFFVRLSNAPDVVAGSVVGSVGDVPVPGDYSAPGDGLTDQATFNRSTGQWSFILAGGDGSATNLQWGNTADIPVPGHYNGNTCQDLATYNRQTALWTIANCAQNVAPLTTTFGAAGDLPVPGDYDGDDKTDISVLAAGPMIWTTLKSGDQTIESYQFGLAGDIPLAARDFSGDGKEQAAVFRPTTGQTIVRDQYGASLVFSSPNAALGDRGALLDVGGDDKADLVTFHPANSMFDITSSDGGSFSNISVPGVWPIAFNPASVPLPILSTQFVQGAVPGDFDRDLRSDFSFVREVGAFMQWIIQNMGGGLYAVDFGLATDTALAGDTDGDLRFEPIVVRENAGGGLEWYVRNPDGSALKRDYGLADDTPVLGDFNCDGKDDISVVRDVAGQLVWYINLASQPTPVSFGLSDDSVFAADMDNDGCDDLVVARDVAGGIYWFTHSLVTSTQTASQWGLTGDLPLHPMDFDGDGSDDPLVVRTLGGVQTAFARKGDGSAEMVNLGATTGTPISGYFTGVNKAEMGVYHEAAGAIPARVSVHRFDGFVGDVILPALVSTDQLVPPSGAVTASSGSPVDCQILSDFFDGRGGKLWKPHSDNTGLPVILMPSSYWGRTASIEIFGVDGNKIIDASRRTCCPNGNRAHYDVAMSGDALEVFAPIYVRFNFGSGGNECFVVGQPDERND